MCVKRFFHACSMAVALLAGMNAALAQDARPQQGSFHFTIDQARAIGETLGIDWNAAPFDPAQFRVGLEVELEHGSRDPQTDVTHDDPLLTGKIAWAHLKEKKDYYWRLALAEGDMAYLAELIRTSHP
jgi:hypothetical protein